MNRKFNLKHIFIFFIDGIGLSGNELNNPLVNGSSGLFYELLGNNFLLDKEFSFPTGILKPIDACLNIEGIPQSATGQTSLFTGVNAAEYLGYHLPGFPNSKLREIIKQMSLFKELKKQGLSVTNINLYSKEYFEYIKRMKRSLLSVSTLLFIEANTPFRLLSQYDMTNAVFMDLTNKTLYERGYDVQIITPGKAGMIAADIIQSHDVSFFEYFLTDRCGHKMNKEWAKEIIDHLNIFLKRILDNTCLENTALFIVSDHGNLEDLSIKSHTLNKVPLIAFSNNKSLLEYSSENVNTLTDFYSMILNLVKK